MLPRYYSNHRHYFHFRGNVVFFLRGASGRCHAHDGRYVKRHWQLRFHGDAHYIPFVTPGNRQNPARCLMQTPVLTGLLLLVWSYSSSRLFVYFQHSFLCTNRALNKRQSMSFTVTMQIYETY